MLKMQEIRALAISNETVNSENGAKLVAKYEA